jgi:cyanophycinase
MDRSRSTFIAIGGGEMAEGVEVLDRIFDLLGRTRAPRVVIMSVATNEVPGTYDKYDGIFRKKNVSHIELVDVSQRKDADSQSSIDKIEQADLIFFTGGDQLNVTGLFGGSPLHDALLRRIERGVVIAGTSAGAAMMSSSMIVDGSSDEAPKAESLSLGPGLDLIEGTIIDTHFSQRGRHGRLITAVAHYPQIIGIGIDPLTAIEVRNGQFSVIGPGAVTIIDAAGITYTDLPYCKPSEPLGIFGVTLHVLPHRYKYDIAKRQPVAPERSQGVGE